MAQPKHCTPDKSDNFEIERKAAYAYMVSNRLEQDTIMNFAVAFLKMLTIYMLWRALFLPNFMPSLPLSEFVIRRGPKIFFYF